jgi:hypothetical protein
MPELRKHHSPMFTCLPARRSDRWLAVSQFISGWYHPLSSGDGYSDSEISLCQSALGITFPRALREWYELAGKRKDVWCNQDSLLSMESLVAFGAEEQEHLIFYAENQGCESWSIQISDLHLEDPPVWAVCEDRRQVCESVSEFAIQTLLRECMWTGAFLAQADLEPADFDRTVQALLQTFTQCRISDRYWDVVEPIHFYEADDAVMITHMNNWIYLSLLNEAVCEALPDWVKTEFEWLDQ